MESGFVYLDYAASSPLRACALEAQARYESLPCAGANPNSLHTLGRMAQAELEKARRTLATCIGGGFRSPDIAFCGGGTEANNICLLGMAQGVRSKDRKRTRVLMDAVEHDSVLDVAQTLKGLGFKVDIVPVSSDGKVDADTFASMLGPDVALVSVMYANNETGVIQPVPELAKLAKKAGALVHTDAIQAFARIPVDVKDADAVTIAGHKFGAPVSAAALTMRGRTPFTPVILGGGQENNRRPGTQDVRNAVALAAAAKQCCDELSAVRPKVQAMANRVYARLCAEGTGIVPTTKSVIDEGYLPGIVNVMVEGLESESMILALDERGYEVSAGSACSTGSLDPSHVLRAMGIPRDLAFGSLRISFDERVSESDLDGFCDCLFEVIDKLRKIGN
jgi:cysteine desulfurase